MNRETLIRELRAIVGDLYVLVEKEDVIVYEQDGSIWGRLKSALQLFSL